MDDLEEQLTSRRKQASKVLQAKLIRLENSVHSMAKQLQQLKVQQQQSPRSSHPSPPDVEDNDLPGQPRDKEKTAPAENLERAAAQEAHTMDTTDFPSGKRQARRAGYLNTVDHTRAVGDHTNRRRSTATTPHLRATPRGVSQQQWIPFPWQNRTCVLGNLALRPLETSKCAQQTCGLKHRASNRSQVTLINRATARSH
ncbi:hypothetical protein MRX96_035540 [Rhipicephalus microplus]